MMQEVVEAPLTSLEPADVLGSDTGDTLVTDDEGPANPESRQDKVSMPCQNYTSFLHNSLQANAVSCYTDCTCFAVIRELRCGAGLNC